MSQTIESMMKAALDGNFYSFVHSNHGVTSVAVKKVRSDHCPNYSFENPFLEGSKRSGWSRAKMVAERSAKLWTPDKIERLVLLRTVQGFGEKKLSRELGISRGEIAGQMRRMGLRDKHGVPFQ